MPDLIRVHPFSSRSPARAGYLREVNRLRDETGKKEMIKLRGADDRFGDYLYVDCASLPSVNGLNQLRIGTHISPNL